MRLLKFASFIFSLCCFAIACSDESTDSSTMTDTADPVVNTNSGGTADSATLMTGGTANEAEESAAMEPEMTLSGGESGENQPGPANIQDCSSLCARYTECGRIGELFATEAECTATCDRIYANDIAVAERWFDCVGREQCDLLQFCPVPPVAALDCARVCGLVETCDVELEFADCSGECTARGSDFRACGEELYQECGNANFVQCLGAQVYNQCDSFCRSAIGCNVVADDNCVQSCVQRYAGGDALAIASFETVAECVAGSVNGGGGADCRRMNSCVVDFSFQTVPLISERDFCMAYDECDPGLLECTEAYARLLRNGGNEALDCAIRSIQDNCPTSFVQLENDCTGIIADRSNALCAQYCLARDVCGLLDGLSSTCQSDCLGGFSSDPDVNERFTSELRCANSNTCEELELCLDGASPEGQCERFCASQAACGVADVDCEANCNGNWARDRHAEYRGCVEAAGADCDAVTACTLAPGIPCAQACERQRGCNIQSNRCEAECDDAHFNNPVAESLRVSCILAATCDGASGGVSVAACIANPEAAGVACLNYCRAQVDCDSTADISGCLTRCVSGYVDREGLIFGAARECLEELSSDTTCDVLDACIPDTPTVDCDAYCTELAACRIPGSESCPASCVAEPPLDRAGCVADAGRTFGGCAAVATCEGLDQPDASAECARFCELRSECDPDVDSYLCQLYCTPSAPASPLIETSDVDESIAGAIGDDVSDDPAGGIPTETIGGVATGSAGETALSNGGSDRGDDTEELAGGELISGGLSEAGGAAEAQSNAAGYAGGFSAGGAEETFASGGETAGGALVNDDTATTDNTTEPAQPARPLGPFYTGLDALSTQLACLETVTCVDFDSCLQLDATVDPRCSDPCEAAVACGAFEALDACEAVCSGQGRSPRALQTYYEQLRSCVTTAGEGDNCDQAAAESCFVPQFCDLFDDLIIIGPNGGSYDFDTGSGPNAPRLSCGGQGQQRVALLTLRSKSEVVLETTSATFDTVLALSTDCNEPAGSNSVACNDDGGSGNLSRIRRVGTSGGESLALEGGQYFVFVAGWNGQRGTGVLQVDITPVCGDGCIAPEHGETCDDGNLISGDGCDSNCVLEGDFTAQELDHVLCDEVDPPSPIGGDDAAGGTGGDAADEGTAGEADAGGAVGGAAAGGIAGEAAAGGAAGEAAAGGTAGETGAGGIAGEAAAGGAAGEAAAGGTAGEAAAGGATGEVAAGGTVDEAAAGGTVDEAAAGGTVDEAEKECWEGGFGCHRIPIQ